MNHEPLIFTKVNNNIKSFIFKISLVLITGLLMFFFQTDPFLGSSSDGFMSSVFIFLQNNLSDINYELKFVHFLRYIIFYPFVLRYKMNLPFWVDSLVYAGIINILLRRKIDYGLLILPAFFSVRSSLCIVSIYGLWMTLIMNKNNFTKQLLSFLLSILSSGVLLNWIFIFFAFNIFEKKIKNLLFCFFSFLFISVFSCSFMHKMQFFSQNQTIEQAAVSVEDTNKKNTFLYIFNRSNLIHNIEEGKMMKAFYYTFLSIMALCSCWFSRKLYPLWAKISLYYSLTGFFLEGLTLTSFLFVYFSVILNFFSNRNLERI